MMRSISDIIAGLNAPVAPDGDPLGWPLAELDIRECRFAVAHPPQGARFCAAPVAVGDWMPGRPGGCYCAFHREFLKRQPRVTAEDDGHRPALTFRTHAVPGGSHRRG